jgi:hypothetical protein
MEQLCSLCTGVEGIVEIESQWTARSRERTGVALLARAHSPAKSAKGGATLILITYERKGQPALSLTGKERACTLLYQIGESH